MGLAIDFRPAAGSVRLSRWPGQAGHDQVEIATSFALLLGGVHNPLIRPYFLGVFRFAQMALADAGNPTHVNNRVLGRKTYNWKA
jgi:hypothetical protein